MAKNDVKFRHNLNDAVVTISGIHVPVANRYHEGPITLTAAEAAAFNAFFNTRVQGSAASNIERGSVAEGKTDDEIRAWIMDYYKNYKFDEPRTLQTVGGILRQIAGEYVNERLAAAGKPEQTGDALEPWIDLILSGEGQGQPGHVNAVHQRFDNWLATREKKAPRAAKTAAIAADLSAL